MSGQAQADGAARRGEIHGPPALGDLDTSHCHERAGRLADERHERSKAVVAAQRPGGVGGADRLAGIAAREQIEDRSLGRVEVRRLAHLLTVSAGVGAERDLVGLLGGRLVR